MAWFGDSTVERDEYGGRNDPFHPWKNSNQRLKGGGGGITLDVGYDV